MLLTVGAAKFTKNNGVKEVVEVQENNPDNGFIFKPLRVHGYFVIIDYLRIQLLSAIWVCYCHGK